MSLAVLHWRNIRMAAGFVSWRHRAEELATKRSNATAALEFWVNLALGSAFAGWQYRVRYAVTPHSRRALYFRRGRYFISMCWLIIDEVVI
jgi:hypothetical protein